MPIELKKFHGERKRIVRVMAEKDNGEIEEIDLTVWHKPITPTLQEELDAIGEEFREKKIIESTNTPSTDTPKELLVLQLAHVLTRWDVIEDGQPVQPTIEVLSGCEYELLAAMSNTIFEPLYPKQTT
jgi:hypothetical protein